MVDQMAHNTILIEPTWTASVDSLLCPTHNIFSVSRDSVGYGRENLEQVSFSSKWKSWLIFSIFRPWAKQQLGNIHTKWKSPPSIDLLKRRFNYSCVKIVKTDQLQLKNSVRNFPRDRESLHGGRKKWKISTKMGKAHSIEWVKCWCVDTHKNQCKWHKIVINFRIINSRQSGERVDNKFSPR